MSLNFGDEKVTKLYYGDKDVSGSPMLETGTLLYSGIGNGNFHLLNTTAGWNNISQLRVQVVSRYDDDFIYFINTTTNVDELKMIKTFTYANVALTLQHVVVEGKDYLSLSNTQDYRTRILVA